jgi:uncharacterized protein YegJ (DUF2314 family)
MAASDEQLVPVFIPALGACLIAAENHKGTPLSRDEVLRLRDKAPCIMMRLEDARKMEDKRGRDINPENCWFDWQQLRRELGRKPDLDPGAKVNQIRGQDPEYLKTIVAAKDSLGRFRAMLPQDGRSLANAMVKTEVRDGDNKVFLWLASARKSGTGFIAKFFELPDGFASRRVGEELEVSEDSLIDWMVNDNGVLHGGFSIRYYRGTLPETEREEYDRYIGVTEYA